MGRGGFAGAVLPWQCPNRTLRSHIPLDVYQEIFEWLKPFSDPDTNLAFYTATLARLALVCRYFAYYASYEMWRSLDLDRLNSEMKTEACCKGILAKLQPVEMLRTRIKECKLQHWTFGNFMSQFIPTLSRLDNLAVLTLRDIFLSPLLLQSIGRLQALEQLVINYIYVGIAQAKGPVFGPHEIPFPALRQLTIERGVDQLFQDALCILVGATKLRSMVIDDNIWLHRLLPHITPQLISLSGNFSDTPPNAFHRFIKGHAALQDLTVYFDAVNNQNFYLNLDLDPDDLPDLRSFSGPFPLVPKVIHTRPVTKLALDCHLPCDTTSTTFLPSIYELTVFPHTHSVSRNIHNSDLEMHNVWTDLESVSGDVHDLFMPMSAKTWFLFSKPCLPAT
ncbi:hypothetical protein JB92DRAFT_3114522 [Gautieria morchelliformis]|nr:hypothetical protein JB92DRAFT_3114522 [Gautieria morchelliformis]